MLNFRESISKEEINSLPVLEYEGRNIVLVDTLSKLKTTINVLKNEEVLGFDTETKPSFEKGKIAKAAAGLIEENDSFLITSGSTIDAFVRNLDAIGSHNVVTASIQVAAVLAEKSGFNAFILGGKVVKDSMSVRDNTAIEELRHIRCNKLFFGCDGLDLQGGVTSADINESRLNIAMMKSASQKILLADSSKIGKIGFGKTCELADIDVLVTDSGISRKTIEQISMLGVKLIIA